MGKLDSCPCSGTNLPRYVQPVLLALLAKEPMYGYSLIQKITELGLFEGSGPDATGIYRKLREMNKSGVLLIQSEESSIGPSRKRYSMTALGYDCLKRWADSLDRSAQHLGTIIRYINDAIAQSGLLHSFPMADSGCSCCAAPTCSAEVLSFLRSVRRRALAGMPARREDVLRLLSFDPDSPEAEALGREAREMARLVSSNTATIWAAIGVDFQPCSMNCAFCSFGEQWGVIKEGHSWEKEDILREIKRFVQEGAAWIVLRTTEHYGEERVRDLMRAARSLLPEGCALVANTSQLSLKALTALRDSGADGVYHALRLGEGRDTPFDPEGRRAALNRITRAGLLLAHLVEPLGAEHSNEEIADAFLAAQAAGALVCGVMARNNVPGTPLENAAPVPEKRLAQIAAVTRLCGGRKMPWICVHPPVSLAAEWGANVVVVETGAVPRDDREIPGEWHGFTIAKARKLLSDAGYTVSRTMF